MTKTIQKDQNISFHFGAKTMWIVWYHVGESISRSYYKVSKRN